VLPPLIVKKANKAVSNAIKALGKQSPYLKSVTPEKKAEIANYAAENGSLASIRYFSKEDSLSQGLEKCIPE